jgi:hypothetical protein
MYLVVAWASLTTHLPCRRPRRPRQPAPTRRRSDLRGLLGLGGVTLELARRRELAELVADHVLGDVHRDELPPVVHRDRVPTISGITVERRDQVLMTFLSVAWFMASTFSSRWTSMNGPFFSDLPIATSSFSRR